MGEDGKCKVQVKVGQGSGGTKVQAMGLSRSEQRGTTRYDKVRTQQALVPAVRPLTAAGDIGKECGQGAFL